MSTIPAFVKSVRQKLNLTQAQLAQSIGVSTTTLNNYETGKQIPGADKIFEMADLIGSPIMQEIETISHGGIGINLGKNKTLNNENALKNDSELHKLFSDCLKAAEAFDQTEYLKQVLVDTKREIAKKGFE
jgi:transcriptional regulator with XRE-family HTH domain